MRLPCINKLFIIIIIINIKLVKFLCLKQKRQKRPKNAHFGCQTTLKQAKLMLIFQNYTVLWSNKMDFQTFIFET